jgi:hypothetical protein
MWYGFENWHRQFLDEAEHDSLVRQAKEGQNRNLSTSLRLRKALGKSLVKLGEKLAPAPQWDEA